MSNKHTGFCISTVKHSIKTVDIPPVNDFDFAAALESVYPLLEIVFSFLNHNDLINVGQVKPSWKIVADEILQKRTNASWLTCYSEDNKFNIMKCSDNLTYNNVGLGIILYDYRILSLRTYICMHTNTAKMSRKTVVEYLSDEILPKTADYCFLSCPKVNSLFQTKKVLYPFSSIFDGIFIPVIPNIRTTMFHCNTAKAQEMKTTISTYIKENEQIKCLLLFSKKNLNKNLNTLLKQLLPGENPHTVPLGGGIILGTKLFLQVQQSRHFSSKDALCIAFLQDNCTESNFNAYSFVARDFETYFKELLRIKDTKLRTDSIGFRISCSAKDDTDDEISTFSQVFPNVPLLGMDVDGEIGWNSLISNDFEEPQSKKAKQKKYPRIQHDWSTVIVLITWGNKIKTV